MNKIENEDFISYTEKSVLKYISWLIDFNDMSTHRGLFQAESLGNCIYCAFFV